ncbi:MAG: DUF4291 domain-containing protein [Kofleriaceae bacterium]|nr:DUF4291 domain-containing protein [Kofleriaceae bacterium]
MRITSERYENQRIRWPAAGRHILAQFDERSVVVYQAYRTEIGEFAVNHGYFGGAFQLNRMTWVKPNFLWMMYRSGWGTKPEQEMTLAVRLKRSAFDFMLASAVHSSFQPGVYSSQESWREQCKRSEIRLQWDPDHCPKGRKEERRAIQIGIRGEALRKYSREWILEIEDVSEFVAQQRLRVDDLGQLNTPREEVYPPANPETAVRIGLGAG